MAKAKKAANAFIDFVTPKKASGALPSEQTTRMGDTGFDPRFDERVKEQQRLNDLTTTVEKRSAQDVPSLYLPDYEGHGFVSSMSDRTAAGGTLTGINDVQLKRPINLRGGQDYMFENPGQVWASAEDPVRAIMMQAAAAKALTGKDPLMMNWRMAPTGGDFAHMTGETMLSFAESNMGKGTKRSLDKEIRQFIPNWKGIDSPDSIAQYRELPDAARKALKASMDKTFRNEGGLGIGEARLSVADPRQLNAPEGYLMNVGRIFADKPIIEHSGHPSYPKGVPGEGVGRLADDRSLFELNPKVFPPERDIRSLLADPSTARDAYENLPDVVTARGIPDPREPRQADTRALQMKPYYGILTEEILRGMGYAQGGLVDSAPEEAIKNTITDPQAFKMLDMDLANLALMNQPQRMAGGGKMVKGVVKKVMPQGEQTNAAAMRQFKQLVEREAPEQYKPITDAMSQSAQTGLEHSVIGNTNSGGESFVTRGTKDSVVPNDFNKDVAIYSPNNPNIIDFHTHPAKFTTFGVDPSIKDLEFYSEQYRKMAKDRELRTLIAIPPERVEFLSRQIARPRTAYNFFATNDPSVLSHKTADDMRYELQRAGSLGAFDAVRSDPRFKEYFENSGGDMGDTLGDATSLLMQRYRAMQNKGRHELQLSGAPMDSGSEVTDSALFDALLNPAMQVLEGKKFAQGGAVHMADGGQVQRFDDGGEVSQSELDRMRFEIAQQQNPNSPVMQTTPRSAIQDAIGTFGGYMDKAGKFVSEAIAPTAEKHPVKHFLANMILADSLKGAGTLMQDLTGTVRETDEDNPVRGVISKDWRKLNTGTEPLLDPRVLDVAGFVTPVVRGATKLAGAGAKAVTPFAKSTAEMAAELYSRGQMPGMVAPNAYMAEPSAPKPAKVLAPANEQGFYSPTEAAALNLQRQSGSGQALLNDVLKGENVRAEEVSRMGLDTFLKDNPNVTAAEVQDYIAQNKLQLGDRTYKAESVKWGEDEAGNLVTENLPRPITISDQYGKTYVTASNGTELGGAFPNRESAQKYVDQLARDDALLPNDLKWAQWSLPGGENHREVTLNLPSGKREDMVYKEQSLEALRNGALDYAAMGDLSSAKQLSTRAEKLEREIEQLKRQPQNRTPEFPKQAELDAIDARMAQLKAEGNREEFGKLQSERSELRRERTDFLRNEQSRIEKEARANQFQSTHWEDPNVLAHLRMSDRVTDGKKTLLVDEVQSDWHQAGRERGYKGDEIDTTGWEVEHLYFNKPEEVAVYDARGKEIWAGKVKGDDDQVVAKVVEELKKKQVPQAPYKEDWYQLALRRAIKEAVDGGYDRVALPTGGEVAQRFGLGNHIDRLDYHKNSDGTYGVSAIKDGREVVAREYLKQNELFDLVGKEVGEKMAKGQGKDSVPIDPDLAEEYGFDSYKSLTGLDLIVGGKGMKKYYDEVYPNYLKKFGKKYGASVGETTVDADGVAKPLRYMDITPAMREEFKTGIHMKKGGKVSFAPNIDAMRRELAKAK